MPTLKWAVINSDDAYGQLMAGKLPATCQKITYGLPVNESWESVHLFVVTARTGKKIFLYLGKVVVLVF